MVLYSDLVGVDSLGSYSDVNRWTSPHAQTSIDLQYL